MPQLAIGLVGAVAFGEAFGTAATFLGVSAASWGFAAGSLLGSVLFPTVQKGQRTTEFQATGSTYGAGIPNLEGVKRLGAQLIDYSPVREVSQSQKVSIGASVQSFTYFQTLRFQICEAMPNGTLLQVYADKKLIIDLLKKPPTPPPAPGGVFGLVSNALIQQTKDYPYEYKVYTGAEDQQPSPWLEAIHGMGNVQPYRGTFDVEFKDFPLSNFGNRIPQFEFVVCSEPQSAIDATIVDPVYADSAGAPHHEADWVWRNPQDPYFYVMTDSPTPGAKAFAKYGAFSATLSAVNQSVLITGRQPGDNGFYPGDGAWGYTMAPFAAPGGDELIVMFQNAFGARFIALDKDSLAVRGWSASSWRPLHVITQFDYPAASLGGDMIAAVSPSGAVFPLGGNIAFWNRTYGSFYFAEFGAMGDAVPPASGMCGNFDDAGLYYLGCADGSIVQYRLTASSGGIQVDKLITRQPFNDGVGIEAMPFNPDTEEFYLFYSNGRFVRWNPSAGVTSAAMHYTHTGTGSFGRTGLIADKLGWRTDDNFVTIAPGTNGRVYLFNASTGTETSHTTDYWGEGGTGHASGQYDPLTETIWTTRAIAGLAILSPNLATAVEIPLADALSRLYARVGIDPSLYDSSGLAQTFHGFSIDQPTAVKDIIGQYQDFLFFDIADTGALLKGVTRGGSSLFTFADADLGGASASSAQSDRLTTTTGMDKDIPQEVDLTYSDPDRDYQSGNALWRRPENTQSSVTNAGFSTPAVMTKGEATAVCMKKLAELWAGRDSYQHAALVPYVIAEPADPVTISRNGKTFEAVLTSVTITPDLVMAFEAVSCFGKLYLMTATGSDSTFVPQRVALIAPPEIEVMDTSLLRQSDDSPGNYATVGPAIPDAIWVGGTAQKSADDVSWGDIAKFGQAPTWGKTQTVLADCPRWTVWDRSSIATVRLESGSLTSMNEDALVDDPSVNLFLIGDELVQGASCLQVDTDLWSVSTFLRGRLGTEAFVTGHGIGDRFIAINSEWVASIPYPASEIASLRYYRAINGSASPISPVRRVTQVTRRLMPRAPYFVRGARGMGGDLTVVWTRRSRVPGRQLWDSPLFEASESYEVDVLDGGGGVKRTITATASAGGSVVTPLSQTVLYTAADQTADFGSLQANVSLKIYQLNGTLGRGWAELRAA